MKRIVLGVLAAAVSGAVYAAEPATMLQQSASSPFSGHIEGYLGGLRSNDVNETTYGAAGRFNYSFHQRWNVQGDLIFDAIDSDGAKLSTFGGAAHIYWRNPESFAAGGFVTLEELDVSPSGGQDIDRWSIGPEGQVYFDNITLYAQAYYGEEHLSAGGPSAVLDFWGIRGAVRYFATENLRFDGELGLRTYDVSDLISLTNELDVFTAALQANYRFSSVPLTVFGRYQFDQLQQGSAEQGLHKYVIGLRFSFGSNSLLDEDRNGATMDTVPRNLIIY